MWCSLESNKDSADDGELDVAMLPLGISLDTIEITEDLQYLDGMDNPLGALLLLG